MSLYYVFVNHASPKRWLMASSDTLLYLKILKVEKFSKCELSSIY